jgi:ArsR family metal-binding transcriptional regulator
LAAASRRLTSAQPGKRSDPGTTAMDVIAAFSTRGEFEKARALLAGLPLPYEVVSPDPGYSLLGAPALVCDSQGLSAIQSDHGIICAGWTEYRSSNAQLLTQNPTRFEEDIFREAAIMFFGPCMADESRIRLIAHLSGDLRAVLPYVNSTMPQACFNAGPCTLTFMDGPRLISLYPRRVTIGKADDLVDGWRTLEEIRVLVNRIWARRSTIVPSYELRSKPPALEIYKRLPRTNCMACGERTCLAFAVSLWLGRASPSRCRPVFSDENASLRSALLEICQGLGVAGAVGGTDI